jgi:hypothetical protein
MSGSSSPAAACEYPNTEHALRLLRMRRKRPRRRRAAEERDELAPLCMTEKEHAEGRRGLGHDRFHVATGSP